MNAAARARVLIVDDEAALRRGLVRGLVRDFDVLTAEDGSAALGLLATTRIDAMLLDLSMPKMSGAEVLEKVKASHPDVEVVVMASHDEVDAAVEAVRAGAYAFLTKPLEPEPLVAVVIHRAIECKRMQGRVRALDERVEQHEQLGEVIAASPRMQEAYRRALGIATAASPVLLEGESGTGKELIARAIHRRSGRATRRFVAVDCAAIPVSCIDDELFGAPSGDPVGRRRGLVESADKGTLFLDAVAELPLPTQATLLRLLMHGDIARGGEVEAKRVDVRILAAAKGDLKARVRAGAFREDLYHRLRVIVVELPPLRQRKEDVALLANHFLHRAARVHAREIRRIGVEATKILRNYAWPGNVRELESAIEHAVLTARGDAIMPSDLPPALSGRTFSERSHGPDHLQLSTESWELPYAQAKERALDAFDRAYVERLMQRAANNVSEAARRAGMDRSNFRRLKKKVESTGGSGRRAPNDAAVPAMSDRDDDLERRSC